MAVECNKYYYSWRILYVPVLYPNNHNHGNPGVMVTGLTAFHQDSSIHERKKRYNYLSSAIRSRCRGLKFPAKGDSHRITS